MVEIFKYLDKFLTSLNNYLTYNLILVIFLGLFLFATFCVIISTSRAYEARLIKSIDSFNMYFLNNPQITEENLVAFNNKMKSKKVPKQLRKQWQQYVLYREAKASHYMSFENCVSIPIKNSTYKRDVKLLNSISWILILASLVMNCYYAFETDFASVLRNVTLCPILILLLNLIVNIFLDLRHSAIVSDLFQNYQYFEVNIDKATETLPDYVDYEVLFDRNEIKKGIPILYAYLQKRAEEEQRELERARLKNVEHEKFDFDDQGVAASLVLERAMQEAENYIAERKKYNQDIQQINSDITQEDMNYREITKEYNRQMQVSKETFENFKAQLEQAASTIEANYLKKQQQQELDRQRNLERDFDTATERHKKIIEQYQSELDTIDKFIAQSRKTLEDAMKSEFKTYSSKVYDEAEKLVNEREKEKYKKLKNDIKNLEEKLVSKSDEIESVYAQNQELSEKLSSYGENSSLNEYEQADEPAYKEEQYQESAYEPESDYQEEPNYEETENVDSQDEYDYEDDAEEYSYAEENNNAKEEFDYNDLDEVLPDEYKTEENEDNSNEGEYQEFSNYSNEEYDFEDSEEDVDTDNSINDSSTVQKDDSIDEKPVASRRGRPKKSVDAQVSTSQKKRGRPRKVTEEVKVTEVKKGRGRPKKVVTESVVVEPKKGRGRPKKVVQPVETAPKKGRGRPKKAVAENVVIEVKKGRGRPKKVTEEVKVTEVKKGRGRPKKVVTEPVVVEPKKGRGRPKKVVQPVETAPKKGRGRPKKAVAENVVTEVKKGRGRPKKVADEIKVVETKKGRGRPKKDALVKDITDIDAYLKQIDDAIAKENARIEETQKELAKKAKIRRKK